MKQELIILSEPYRKYFGGDRRHIICQCYCGEYFETDLYNVRKKVTRSCGCLRKKQLVDRSTKHGLRYHKLYGVWCSLRNRCYNKKNKRFSSYGARGITVCKEWLEDFVKFYEWAIANGWGKGLILDRKDNDGNYCPENCRFITNKKSCNNKSNNRYITSSGQTLTLSEWADKFQIKFDVLRNRLNSGWTFEKAISTPVKKRVLL